ncbi:MAG: ExeM/NucH family extracellular endonuclease, partial [Actinobacteria bacterium]|nr:ExeM/NucH family extracellular endonuclease [Actinomycetota bacterium]
GTIDDEAAGMGALSFLRAGIQNGSPDGWALIDDTGAVIEFLSYEGSFTATSGTANGMTSVDIGVAEASTTPAGQSLQLIDDTWVGPADASPGDLNTAVVEPFLCGDPATAIHDVQGSGAATPIPGVVTVEGIVVGDFQAYASTSLTDDPLLGFMLQEEDTDADADVATSEGVFVYNPGGTDVAVGDLVRVKGTAQEYYDLTEIGNVTDLLVCSSGNTLPTPASPVVPTALADPVVDWEAIEGMGVVIAQPLYVTEMYRLGSFGEIKLSAIGAQDHPNQVATVGTPAATEVYQLNQNSRVTLDDGEDENENYGNDTWNPATTPYLSAVDGTLRSGDSVTGLAGVVHYSFGEYEIQPVNVADPTDPAAAVTFVRANPRPDLPDVGGTFKVASFNVLNYFTTLGSRGASTADEFERQATKIVEAIIDVDADVVGLMEIENNDAAIIDLVGRLNGAAGATRTYGYIDTGVVGTDQIKVAIIYDTATAAPVGGHAVLDSSVSPAFLDDKNRPAVAQTFEEMASGNLVTVAVNHLKSKGSDCDTTSNPGDPAYGVAPYGSGDDLDWGVYAGNCNLTRTAAAQVLGQWVEEVAAANGATYGLIIGDLNSYAREDPITTLEALGYTDLHEVFDGGNSWQMGGHTYVFDGEHGSLDYAMGNDASLAVVTGAAAWHINADEPPALDYEDWNPPANYTADQWRASDHDPVIVGLQMPIVPRRIKAAAIDDVEALIGLGTTKDDKTLAKVITDLERSLDESRWTSDFTLQAGGGAFVFERERQAVSRLLLLSPALADAAQDVIDDLVLADRELAMVAIDLASAAGEDVTKATGKLAQGDAEAASGDAERAIQRYMQAWQQAV